MILDIQIHGVVGYVENLVLTHLDSETAIHFQEVYGHPTELILYVLKIIYVLVSWGKIIYKIKNNSLQTLFGSG
jgi:hypothetical protein